MPRDKQKRDPAIAPMKNDRPRAFWQTDIDANKLSPHSVEMFLRLSMRFRNSLSLKADPLMPVKETVVDKAVERAKDAVLAADAPPCAWRWNEVKEIIKKYGVRLVVSDYGLVNPYEDQVSQSEGGSVYMSRRLSTLEELSTKDEDEVAASFVYNATAIVFERLMMKASGYSIGMLEYAENNCNFFAAGFIMLQSSVEDWNAFRYAKATSKNPQLNDQTSIKTLDSLDHGEVEQWVKMQDYTVVDRLVSRKLIVTSLGVYVDSSGFECDFPPIISGENKGYEFRPYDVDEPLLNYFEQQITLNAPGSPKDDHVHM
ncbi:MAG: hypothetical protein WC477_07010 [Patescibacteria group bacterium]